VSNLWVRDHLAGKLLSGNTDKHTQQTHGSTWITKEVGSLKGGSVV